MGGVTLLLSPRGWAPTKTFATATAEIQGRQADVTQGTKSFSYRSIVQYLQMKRYMPTSDWLLGNMEGGVGRYRFEWGQKLITV